MKSDISRVVDSALESCLNCWLRNDMAEMRRHARVVLENFFDDSRPQTEAGVEYNPIPYGRGTVADGQRPIVYCASVAKESGANLLAISVQFPSLGQPFVDWEFRLSSPADRVAFFAPERPDVFNAQVSALRRVLKDWE